MGLLENRVVILTGGAGNIGKYVSRLVAAEGGAVVISDLKAEFAETLAQEIRDAGGRAVADRGGRASAGRHVANLPRDHVRPRFPAAAEEAAAHALGVKGLADRQTRVI